MNARYATLRAQMNAVHQSLYPLRPKPVIQAAARALGMARNKTR
ncbi:MAG: hypothetical protein AAFV53_06380 [Myxococcota bacterium]